ncbi:MAG: hypothetical protein AABZ47_18855, partial [Planctomycetota bacterium]
GTPTDSQTGKDSTDKVATRSEPAAKPLPTMKDGIPIFRREVVEKNRAADVPRFYFARFEDDVDVKQNLGDATASRLQSAALEIIRRIVDADPTRTGVAPKSSQSTAAATGDPKPSEHILVTWSGRLVVEALGADDPRRSGGETLATALGTPVRLSNRDGEAQCAKAVFRPDEKAMDLLGAQDAPVKLQTNQRGTLLGREVKTRREGDGFVVEVQGPGMLTLASGNQVAGALTSSPDSSSTIQFAETLQLQGRYLSKTSFGLASGVVTQKKHRVLDQADFKGRVRMRDDDLSMDADKVHVEFAAPLATVSDSDMKSAMIRRVHAEGNVAMTREADRLSAREVDIEFGDEVRGRMLPALMTAAGDVVAQQGTRSIVANDKLIVTFETVSGLQNSSANNETKKKEDRLGYQSDVRVKRLQAFGDVMVTDPTQGLDLSAKELDCTVREGREIETALVVGREDRPASVQLGALSVMGREVRMNVLDQRAEVPGAGRMTLLSQRDLDGRQSSKPVPIVITWRDGLNYQGRENRAVFTGSVHAASENSTTFDTDRLVVEFDEVQKEARPAEQASDWWIFNPLVRSWSAEKPSPENALWSSGGASKQPAYLLATGKAIVTTTVADPVTGELKTRASIRGPKLSVNLRQEVSKMLIEGDGSLLLEDFRSARATSDRTRREADSFFGVNESSGPSKTLITWRELMWYDFSIEQTRFEGDVQLKHFSGLGLDRLVRMQSKESTGSSSGRSTFLSCDVLTADFHSRTKPRPIASEDQRMGKISSDRLRQFQATGSVVLEDPMEGLSLSGDSVAFEKDRSLLAIHGSSTRPARVILQKPGEYPQDITTQRCFYNFATHSIELASQPTMRRR